MYSRATGSNLGLVLERWLVNAEITCQGQAALAGDLLLRVPHGAQDKCAGGAEVSGGSGDDGGGAGGGNDLGGGLGEEAVKGLRSGRRIVGLCVTVWGAVE